MGLAGYARAPRATGRALKRQTWHDIEQSRTKNGEVGRGEEREVAHERPRRVAVYERQRVKIDVVREPGVREAGLAGREQTVAVAWRERAVPLRVAVDGHPGALLRRAAVADGRDPSAQHIDDVRVLRRHIVALLGVGLDLVQQR